MKKKRYAEALAVCIVLALAVLIRMHAAGLPLMDRWAESAAESAMRQQAALQVEKEYATAPPEKKEELTLERLAAILGKNREAIEKKADEYREKYRDEKGQTYLIGIDPYYYLHKAQNRELDNTLSWLIHFCGRLGIRMETGAFWLPVAFTMLACAMVYLLARQVAGPAAGFVASALLAVHPEFLKYSLAGLCDTNVLNIFFILSILWLFCMLAAEKGMTGRIVIGSVIVIAVFAFRYTWYGYFIAAVIAVLAYGLHLAVPLFQRVPRWAFPAAVCLGLILSVMFFPQIRSLMPERLASYLGENAGSEWPSGMGTIRELSDLDIWDMVGRMGGLTLVFLALLWGAAQLSRRQKGITGAAVVLCFLGFGVLAVHTLRILPFALPFLCIMAGAGFVWFIGLAHQALPGRALAAAAAVALLIPVSMAFAPNYEKAFSVRPTMDDSIYGTGRLIDRTAGNSALVFAWWDRGHLLEAASNRTVLAKAAPQMPRTYWMARALWATDPDVSRGLIRLVACGGDWTILSLLPGEMNERVEFAERLAALDRAGAAQMLKENGLDSKILKKTHCSEREVLLVLTDDMTTKLHNLAMYATWDFERAASAVHSAFSQYRCRDGPVVECSIGSQVFRVSLDDLQTNFAGKSLHVTDLNATRVIDPDARHELFIYMRGESRMAVLVPTETAQTMLFQLLFGRAPGMFGKLSDISDPLTVRTVVYSVEWE